MGYFWHGLDIVDLFVFSLLISPLNRSSLVLFIIIFPEGGGVTQSKYTVPGV